MANSNVREGRKATKPTRVGSLERDNSDLAVVETLKGRIIGRSRPVKQAHEGRNGESRTAAVREKTLEGESP